MDYISVSSLITDFWTLLFYPIIKFGLIVFMLQFVLGKDRFNRMKLKLFDSILQYGQKIKYRERLDKAVPIMNVFLFFSFLYLFSLLSSYIESFIHLNVSFRNSNYLSSETVLNVWRYHPYIEDFTTLKKVVYYKAEVSELNTFQILSTEGFRHLPDMLLRSLIVFILVFLILSIAFFLLKIIKRGIFKRMLIILRAILVLFILIALFVFINFLNRNYENDYSVQAWTQYEAQVLSSGAPPESNIDIKKEKLDEVNESINKQYYDFSASLGFGEVGISITYTDHGFDFNIVHYRNNG